MVNENQVVNEFAVVKYLVNDATKRYFATSKYYAGEYVAGAYHYTNQTMASKNKLEYVPLQRLKEVMRVHFNGANFNDFIKDNISNDMAEDGTFTRMSAYWGIKKQLKDVLREYETKKDSYFDNVNDKHYQNMVDKYTEEQKEDAPKQGIQASSTTANVDVEAKLRMDIRNSYSGSLSEETMNRIENNIREMTPQEVQDRYIVDVSASKFISEEFSNVVEWKYIDFIEENEYEKELLKITIDRTTGVRYVKEGEELNNNIGNVVQRIVGNDAEWLEDYGWTKDGVRTSLESHISDEIKKHNEEVSFLEEEWQKTLEDEEGVSAEEEYHSLTNYNGLMLDDMDMANLFDDNVVQQVASAEFADVIGFRQIPKKSEPNQTYNSNGLLESE